MPLHFNTIRVPPLKTQLCFFTATEATSGLGDAQPGGEQGEGEEVEGEVEGEEEEEEEKQEEEEKAIESGKGTQHLGEGGGRSKFSATCQNKCLYFHSSKVTAQDDLF